MHELGLLVIDLNKCLYRPTVHRPTDEPEYGRGLCHVSWLLFWWLDKRLRL